MIIENIISVGRQAPYTENPRYLGTVLALADGDIWVGDVFRGDRIIQWVQYSSVDYTKRD